jgi:Tol biopolymer transport system component
MNLDRWTEGGAVKRSWALLVVVTWGVSTLAAASPAGAVVPGPNGRIAFCRYIPEIDSCDLYTANADGTDEQLLLPGPAEAPRWSPDGSRIAIVCFQGEFEFVRNCTMNPDGSDFVQLVPDPTLNEGVGAWSPDRTRLAFEGWDDVNPDRTPGVFTMRSSDGGNLSRLTTNPYGGHDIPTDYSPDGSRVLFLREKPLLNHNRSSFAIFRVNRGGTGVTQLTPWGLAAGGGRWSPDGTSIVFADGSNRFKGSLWVVGPNGTDLHKIFQDDRGGVAFQPTWSPRGNKIIFALVRSPLQGGQEDLYSVHADGTGLAPVTNTPDFEDSPDWGTNLG